MTELTLIPPVRGQKFRDSRGRFRRKTRDDMGVFEQIMADAAIRCAERLIADGYFNETPNLLLSTRVEGGVHIRTPATLRTFRPIE